MRADVSPARMQVDLRAMESVQRRDAACSTLASFVVEDGKPGPLKS
jgi:alkaline phosphatase D